MTSPWVQRNLDGAQYAQAHGSQYEGPRRWEPQVDLNHEAEPHGFSNYCTHCRQPIKHGDSGWLHR